MLGNVAEWCHDGQRAYTGDVAIDPLGPTHTSVRRVMRGGHWGWNAQDMRIARRSEIPPRARDRALGFRCVSS